MICASVEKAKIGNRVLWVFCGLDLWHYGDHFDAKRNHRWDGSFHLYAQLLEEFAPSHLYLPANDYYDPIRHKSHQGSWSKEEYETRYGPLKENFTTYREHYGGDDVGYNTWQGIDKRDSTKFMDAYGSKLIDELTADWDKRWEQAIIDLLSGDAYFGDF